MKLLYSYLKNYWKLVLLALFLATINQTFSLLDPLVFRYVIDNYALKFSEYTTEQFLRGVVNLLLLAMGVAFVSRVAKNFQDYYINVIVQRLGAQIYADGLKHSLELPYSVFEDQRSGETLGKLQKVRTDVERLISAAINILFTTLVGITFVMIYSLSVHWLIAPLYFSTVPILAFLSSTLSKKIKTIQKTIVGETTALAGSTTESLRNIELVKSLGLATQEIDRLNNTTQKILRLELKKVKEMGRYREKFSSEKFHVYEHSENSQYLFIVPQEKVKYSGIRGARLYLTSMMGLDSQSISKLEPMVVLNNCNGILLVNREGLEKILEIPEGDL